MSTDISDAVGALLATHPQAAGSGGWDEDLGEKATLALARDGWLGVGLHESLGGQGGDFADAVAVAEAVSAAGWPSPVADVLLVTNALLTHAGAARPGGGIAVVVPVIAASDRPGRVRAHAPWAPWATWAEHLLFVVENADGPSTLVAVDATHATVSHRYNLAGAPWGDVEVADAPSVTIGTLPEPAERVMERIMGAGALARSIQVSVAMQQVRDLAVAHALSRIQFGRPLARFQAVQQNLAMLAGVAAAAGAAVRQAGGDALDPFELADNPRLAVAKVQTSVAANEASRLAHQIHGAIGVTREHELHRHTLAMLSAREEFGTEFMWGARLATAVRAAPDAWEWLCNIGNQAALGGEADA
jgi:acyl-CoA dehydrogenase